MGSFFRTALNPAGAIFGHNSILGKIGGSMTEGPVAFAGPNSFLAKESAYDPILGSTAGKYINPAAYSAGQGWDARHAPPPGYMAPATPYAGVNPTLNDAAGNYGQQIVQASQDASQRGQATRGVQPPQNTQQQSRQNAAYSAWG